MPARTATEAATPSRYPHLLPAGVRPDRRDSNLRSRLRRPGQLGDNLAALQVHLPGDAVRRLDEVSPPSLGFPAEFIASSRGFVYGAAGEQTDSRIAGGR